MSYEVYPHFMAITDTSSDTPGCKMTLSDTSLRVGEVIKAFSPSDPKNISRKIWEYIVLVNHRDQNGSPIQTPYRCTIKDGFGSAGDHLRYSVRSATRTGQESVGNGAIVLVLCINGDLSNAVIIDCLFHPNRQDQDPSARFFDFEFNGAKVKINDDGSISIQCLGATKNDGSPDNRESTQYGSKIDMLANGEIQITDNNTSGIPSKITINPSEQKIKIEGNEVENTGTTGWTVTAPTVNVVSPNVNLGAQNLPPTNGLVLGSCICPVTGTPHLAFGGVSTTVKANL